MIVCLASSFPVSCRLMIVMKWFFSEPEQADRLPVHRSIVGDFFYPAVLPIGNNHTAITSQFRAFGVFAVIMFIKDLFYLFFHSLDPESLAGIPHAAQASWEGFFGVHAPGLFGSARTSIVCTRSPESQSSSPNLPTMSATRSLWSAISSIQMVVRGFSNHSWTREPRRSRQVSQASSPSSSGADGRRGRFPSCRLCLSIGILWWGHPLAKR